MYWIYLIIFTVTVFVPTFITDGFYMFNETQTQELVILLLGSLCFSLFLAMEKKLKENIKEKNKYQSQIGNMTRDLKNSYSYIGESNRKLDILENISLNYPDSVKMTQKNRLGSYASIMEAIRVFGKSEDFVLKFSSYPDLKILQEIKSKQEIKSHFSLKEHVGGINHIESDDFIVIISPKVIDKIFCYIVIKKNTPSQKIEDVELMKTIATQALFIFMFIQNKKQLRSAVR
ncbi:MAG: hypothetical protein ACD_8C00101G0027 [uncultured bacterium]|nr:MAG: hypothetical protein ACD_8C00101G0027 [uncultured bacterium]